MVMRKVQSAPQICGLDTASQTCATARSGTAVGSVRPGLHSRLSKCASGGLQRKPSSPTASGLRKRCASHNALPTPMPPQSYDDQMSMLSEVVEQADELLEEAVWAKGLIPAAECFELFGWTETAPALKDSQPVTEDQRKALASCLATPFMYDDEHLSKQAQRHVARQGQAVEQRVTERYVEELQNQQKEEAEENTSSFAGQEAVARSRRRKRSSQLLLFGVAGNQASSLAERTASPDTHKRLSGAFRLEDNHKNKLHFDEDILAEKKNNLATSSLDPASMAMEVLDEDLFAFSSINKAQLVPGRTMEASKDGNALSVTPEKAKEVSSDPSQASAAAAAQNEPNQMPEDKILLKKCSAAEGLSSRQTQETKDSGSNVAIHDHVKNSIVPFLVGKIAKVLG